MSHQDDGQEFSGYVIQARFAQFAFLHRFDDFFIVDAVAGGHFQVQARCNTGRPFIDGAPVGNDKAFEAPLFFQDIIQKVRILGSVYPIDLVVSTHDRPGLRFLDGNFECGQVDLVERLFVYVRTHGHSLELLVIDRKMFQGSSDALVLHTIDIGGGQLTREDGVFGKVLEIAPAQG